VLIQNILYKAGSIWKYHYCTTEH